MKHLPRLAQALVAAAGLLLAGCASAPPPHTLLALPSLDGPPATPGAGAAADAVAAPPVLVVRRLALPEYLLARRVRYRDADASVGEWPGTFWAERIEVGMTRELTQALRAQLPGWTLCEAECATTTATPGLALRLELSPLDYRRDARELQAVARMSLECADHTLLQRSERRHVLSAAADSPQAYAAALGTLLQRVAQDAAALAQAAR